MTTSTTRSPPPNPLAKPPLPLPQVEIRPHSPRLMRTGETKHNLAPKDMTATRRSDEICLNFLDGRCPWGDRCHRKHVRPPLAAARAPRYPHNVLNFVPANSRNDFVVKLPKRQLSHPTFSPSQNTPLIDLTSDSFTPIVRLRPSNFLHEKPSQNFVPDMPRFEGLSCDEKTNFWGWKTDERAWTGSSVSSDDSLPESADSSSTLSTTTSSHSSAGPPHSMSRPERPPPARDICWDWQRGCRRGYNCRYVHTNMRSYSTNSSVEEPTLPAPPRPEPIPPADDSLPESAGGSSTLSTTMSSQSSADPPHSMSRPERPPPAGGICRYWLRGCCWKDSNCRFAHGDIKTQGNIITSSVKELSWAALPRSEPIPPEPPLTITIHDHTKVKIGPGFDIHEVTTSVENPWIVLSNIPSRVGLDVIKRMLSPFGSLQDVKIPNAPPKDAMTVKARFSNHAEALQASTALDGSAAFKTRLSARIPVNSRSGTVSLQDSTVKIQWEAPQRVAYGGYSTAERAQKAIAVTKKPCGDHFVRAVIYVGLPSIGAVTVKFTNLPPKADDKFMERFSPEDLMWERANYLTLAPAVEGVRRILDNAGSLVEMDVIPPPYSHGLIRAWATFSSSSTAKSAAVFLHGRKPLFTGKTRIFAHHVQTLTYPLTLDEYEKHATLIQAFREVVFQGSPATSVTFRRQPTNVLIRLSAEGIKELGWLKAEFEKILRGELVRSDGVAVWDGSFVRTDGARFLHSVQMQTGVRIEADPIRQCLKLFGTPSPRNEVRAILLKKLTELQAQQVRTVRVPGRVVNAFVVTQLSQLCRKFGAENINVNSWDHSITFRGGDELYKAGTDAVHQAQQTLPAQPISRENALECPVCFNCVVSPVNLRCGHTWCRNCLAQYLLAAIDNRRFPLTCLGNEAKCSESISLAVARNILQPSEFNSIVDAALSSYVHAHAKELHYCPSVDCSQIYRTGPKGTVVQCPACLLRICSHCHAEAHDGLTCAEQDGGDKLFKEWAAHHDVKNCPGCAIPIERDEGCHHVTCIQCQTHICWVCLQTFPKGEGIYGHMRAEHGGIGLGQNA